jgi:hypothetical protein
MDVYDLPVFSIWRFDWISNLLVLGSMIFDRNFELFFESIDIIFYRLKIELFIGIFNELVIAVQFLAQSFQLGRAMERCPVSVLNEKDIRITCLVITP